MKIVDTHCDALLKLWESRGKLSYSYAPELESNYQRLKQGEVFVQFFALFIPPAYPVEQKFAIALEQIDLFYSEVLTKHPQLVHIKEWSDLEHLQEGQIGAVLALEGADAIGNDLRKLHILHRLGVRSVGLTWNKANLCADGIEEPRGAGLTELGKQVVQFNNEHFLFTDVSHLSERGFWDVLELADYPLASHSNSKTICPHRRNLTDEQARALFAKGGYLGIVFYPPFVKREGEATIADVIKHIEHFCALGGARHLGFGSDFDGIEQHIKGLENASMYQNLINELLKHYKEELVRGFAYQNFLDHLPKRAEHKEEKEV